MRSQDAIYRFGPYELWTRTREVYKNGIKLKVRPQPFQILQALVERAGDVVTREELRQRLWPAEIFVDFEHGLNTAIKELRGLLNDSASEPQYIETLPKLGYRILVPMEAVEPPVLAWGKEAVRSQRPASEGAPYTRGEEHPSPDRVGINSDQPLRREDGGTKPPPDRRRWAAPVAVATMMIVGVAVYGQWSRWRAQARAPSGRVMLAVLPFENLTGDASQDYFSDGLTEEMIGQLGRLDPQRLGVIARTSVMHYKHAPQSLQQIGRELGVQYVLEGSVRRDADKVRISAQLIQLKDQTHLWSRQYDRELGSLLTLQSEIARQTADEIQITFGTPKHTDVVVPSGSSPSLDSEAHDLYLKGLYFWNKRTVEGFQQAIQYFQNAIGTNPNYAQAYTGLANSYSLLTSYTEAPGERYMPKARAAALRALELEPSLAEAQTARALVVQNYDYDWETSEKEFRRAIALNPNYSTAHHWYAEHLMWMGRFEEAFEESEKARQLDPLSLIIAVDYADILYNARQYGRAIAQFHAIQEMDPNFPRVGILIGSYIEKGMFPEALALVKSPSARENLRWYWALQAYVHGRAGQREEARGALRKLQDLSRREKIQPTVFVRAYLGVGDKERALTYLEKAYAERYSEATTLKVDPMYDSLRGDRRFQELLRRVGLTQ